MKKIEWKCNCSSDTRLQNWLNGNLKDIIEHWIFYPQITVMGLTPDPETSKDVGNIIQQDRYPAGNNLSVQELAVYYFRGLTLPIKLI